MDWGAESFNKTHVRQNFSAYGLNGIHIIRALLERQDFFEPAIFCESNELDRDS